MSDERQGTSPFAQMRDELRLQAWLAQAEFKHPSLHEGDTRDEVDALAAMRDELRLQMHLGKLEARDQWHQLEGRWQRLKQLADDTADDVGDRIRDLVGQIRKGYRQLDEGGGDTA